MTGFLAVALLWTLHIVNPFLCAGRLVRVHSVRLLQHQLPQLLVEWGQVPWTCGSHAGVVLSGFIWEPYKCLFSFCLSLHLYADHEVLCAEVLTVFSLSQGLPMDD